MMHNHVHHVLVCVLIKVNWKGELGYKKETGFEYDWDSKAVSWLSSKERISQIPLLYFLVRYKEIRFKGMKKDESRGWKLS